MDIFLFYILQYHIYSLVCFVVFMVTLSLLLLIQQSDVGSVAWHQDLKTTNIPTLLLSEWKCWESLFVFSGWF